MAALRHIALSSLRECVDDALRDAQNFQHRFKNIYSRCEVDNMAPGLNELLLWHGTSRKAGLEVSMQPASSKLARVLYDGGSEHIYNLGSVTVSMLCQCRTDRGVLMSVHEYS